MSQPPSKQPDYMLTLPVELDQLGLFIAGLLGKSQTIEKLIRGPFLVDRTDLENLYHLIEQRISSQNAATLVGFTAKTIYDNASSVFSASAKLVQNRAVNRS
jgi:hypothetical protein